MSPFVPLPMLHVPSVSVDSLYFGGHRGFFSCHSGCRKLGFPQPSLCYLHSLRLEVRVREDLFYKLTLSSAVCFLLALTFEPSSGPWPVASCSVSVPTLLFHQPGDLFILPLGKKKLGQQVFFPVFVLPSPPVEI